MTSQTTSLPASNKRSLVPYVIEQSNPAAISEPWHSESDRVRLARASRQAALAVRGVRAMDAGSAGAFMTGADDGERLQGVTCIAAPEGGYEVSLRLVAGLGALHPLGQRVRAAVVRVASFAGIELADVTVHFADLTAEEPG
jgi:hypothetical protein